MLGLSQDPGSGTEAGRGKGGFKPNSFMLTDTEIQKGSSFPKVQKHIIDTAKIRTQL